MEQKLCPGCEEPVIDKLPGCPLQCGTVQCKAFKKKPVYDFEIMPIVWVMGGPGSGKTEQSLQLCNMYGLVHVSVGAMLRAEMARGTERAKCFNSVMGRGELAPNDLVLAMLKTAIEEGAAMGARGFVVDGFPREKSQGPSFERFVGPLIIYLDATVETLFTRIKDRKKTPGRIDETPDALKLRLETFMKHHDSVYDIYKFRLVKINANVTPEQMAAQIKNTMDAFMHKIDALKQKKAEEARKAEEDRIADLAKREAYIWPARKEPQPYYTAAMPERAAEPGGNPSNAGSYNAERKVFQQTEASSKPGSPTGKPKTK